MTENRTAPYRPTHHVRIVTAASLFDGHDAAINIMRRILQASGAEVIHLGHNRSVAEIVECAIEEDAQGIALTSYQGGHVEYLKYMFDMLAERGACTKIFGGGGGTILPSEIDELHAYGVARIYSPDDGRAMGLQGMINDLLEQCEFEPPRPDPAHIDGLASADSMTLARLITVAENDAAAWREIAPQVQAQITDAPPVLGITGTGGSGKSSMVDELVRRFIDDFADKRIAVLSIDPSKRKTGGALLGDRIRMNSIHHPRVYMRSLATRQSNLAMSPHVKAAIDIVKAAGFDLVIVETSGIGQSDTEITEHSDVSLYVMTAEYGAATQLEKIDMLDFADVVAINKFDKPGSLDALRDVRKQVRRNRQWFDKPDEALAVYGTIASQFNDPGTHVLYRALMDTLVEKTGRTQLTSDFTISDSMSEKRYIIPPERVRYLAEIADAIDRYDALVEAEADKASRLYRLEGAREVLQDDPTLAAEMKSLEATLQPDTRPLIENWPAQRARYEAEVYSFQIRDKTIEQPLRHETLSGLSVPRVILPRYRDWGDLVRWQMQENVPGSFPFTAGVFPLKREGEDPTRMFAGEGGPERTNKRFHYLSEGMPAARLSTAFDSVTLYGEDPDPRPDIYGKVGNSGVSIATVDDAKKLYCGFDLAAPSTSVSMTINGPAPILLAFFMNAAIDQQCERYLKEQRKLDDADRTIQAKYDRLGLPRPRYQGALPAGSDGLGLALLGASGDEVLDREVYERIKADTLKRVRGTVQADILKEDQAQNTCIFSTEFSLRMMGDIQAYFTEHGVRNFYSVSISGYHIAEAGANPISQLAFTLANGFTFVEYYLSRGLAVDAFAPNLSFFFSNGLDPEYTVIGRVARRIWAKAMKHRYGANERSQKLKYHIQTSGRSLHAQEIAFNDIRTTLQALTAIYDNCNSLHTNAYDEAITTPTEESVRRAVAIQLIITKELGLAKNENPMQGSFIIEELTDLVEEAVMLEFRRINDRGGVLGAMERMYQRTKIQEESMLYESKKHSGELPVIGVNTFLDPKGSPTIVPAEVIRSRDEEKRYAIESRRAFQTRGADARQRSLATLKKVAVDYGNTFEALLETVKHCSLGDISAALYEVGGQYRRNM
ncbi:MAG: methylmalonyl-CoA mutase family protein [Myxococcota bacterium]